MTKPKYSTVQKGLKEAIKMFGPEISVRDALGKILKLEHRPRGGQIKWTDEKLLALYAAVEVRRAGTPTLIAARNEYAKTVGLTERTIEGVHAYARDHVRWIWADADVKTAIAGARRELAKKSPRSK